MATRRAVNDEVGHRRFCNDCLCSEQIEQTFMILWPFRSACYEIHKRERHDKLSAWIFKNGRLVERFKFVQ